ncbi:helicase-related protein [Pelomonas sp. SE-A7]|uniref:helicase-related protein n=1 Tax=Pelomonas sp. SE-A7 TaxID=3054953 RepID=UPI00259CED03|nr:helicase-related protein [Pelomonas sp. SE-A7]MDM4765589.1 hypothetical protein [Pelomonas sp. SE-A7]
MSSEDGSCEHGRFLVEQIGEQALNDAQAPAYSELWLAEGLQRLVCWRAGSSAPQALIDAAEALFDAEARLDPERSQGLDALLGLAAELGHELRVEAEVWAQLAHGAEARERLVRLESALRDQVELQTLAGLARPLPEYQWEAVLFALCAGRSLIADDLALGHRATAIAVIALSRKLFGLGPVVVLAPLDRHQAWRDEMSGLLGTWPEDVQLLQRDQAPLADAELLIVDGVQHLESVPDLPTPQLLLLADRELLGEPLLGSLLEWLDPHRRGPQAAWQRETSTAGKRLQRELLQSVMLSRRKRDLQPRLPATMEQELRLDAEVELDQTALAQLRQAMLRWQRSQYLASGEQPALLQALQKLRLASSAPEALAAKAQRMLSLLANLVPASAQRVAVFAQQDATAVTLAEALRAEGLAVATLLKADAAEARAEQLSQWHGDAGLVLVAVDAACQGLDLVHEQAALVHADLPWNPALLAARADRINGVQGRALPVFKLLVEQGFDAAQLAAQQGQAGLPSATLDHDASARPFLAAAELAPLMTAVEKALGVLGGA